MEPYPARIVKAYRQVDSLGLVNYWRNLATFIMAASSLDELKKEWDYACRVADTDNLLWCVIHHHRAKRMWELQQASK